MVSKFWDGSTAKVEDLTEPKARLGAGFVHGARALNLLEIPLLCRGSFCPRLENNLVQGVKLHSAENLF